MEPGAVKDEHDFGKTSFRMEQGNGKRRYRHKKKQLYKRPFEHRISLLYTMSCETVA